MRSKTIMMIVMALVFGTAAVLAGQRWLDAQSIQRLRAMQEVPQAAKPVATRTVVVAAMPLRFGTEITHQHLREIAWPEGAVPKGTFGKITEVIDGKTRRVALAAVEENEPLLAAKMTGPGQRASLAAVIDAGMKAMTVRVNDVNGVAGFVLPGERVDILVTRTLERNEAYTDVLLQNMKVLAVDQLADERADKPALVKAVTLEVNTCQAQKLTLGATVGTLSLALRAAGIAELETTQRVGVDDLARPVPTAFAEAAADSRRTVAVGVTRALKRQEYSVPTLPETDGPQIGTASIKRVRELAPREPARPATTAIAEPQH